MDVKFVLICSFLILLNLSLSNAQSSGAYSSPQYTKKSYYNRKYNQQGTPEINYQRISQSDNSKSELNDKSKHQELDIFEISNPHQIDGSNVRIFENQGVKNNALNVVSKNETQSGRSSGGFMETAGEFWHGRGGQMLADIARELITRSTGASSQVGAGEGCFTQVLSLNLTNLVILVILKALILAAGMFGAGAWTHGYGRSIDDNSNSQLISGSELDLWMNYLQGRPECLQLASCKSPKLAKKYSGGADLLLTAAKFTNGLVPYDVRYEKVLEHVKEATTWGTAGMKCEERYKC